MLTDRKIAIVIACYKDAGSIEEMLRRVHETMNTVTPHYEIIYVNEASPDGAELLLNKAFEKDKRLTVINHSRNFGAQNAFTSGIANSHSDAVVLMDGDLQDPPELIASFVQKWVEGYDVVYGIRQRRKIGILKGASYKIFYKIYKALSYVQVPLDAGDFSLIDRKVADILVAMPERDRFLRGLRAWVGFKQIGVSYARPERFSGTSNHSLLDNIRWAKMGIFSLSFKPLEGISYLAFAMVFLSGLAIAAYIYFYFRFGAPPGFVTLLVVTLFLGGIQLLCLAVMAEYIGRIFEEVKGRPRYIIKNIARHDQ